MANIVTQQNNPFFEKEVVKTSTSSRVVNLLQGLVILAFVGIVLYLFVATPNQVNGRSMLPNFVTHDLLLTNRMVQWFHGTSLGDTLGLNYERGDVVVVSTPELPTEEYIIKRVLAIPGDTVGIREGFVYLNGQRLDEPYLPPQRRTQGGNVLVEGDTLTVPADNFVIMGDNRNESLDSRNTPLGFIEKSQMIGRVIFRFWPPERLGYIGRSQDTSSEYSRSL